MLTKTLPTSVRKTVVLKSAVNQILYIVPPGKTFVGRIITFSSYQILINNIEIAASNTTDSRQFEALELTSGTIVSCGPAHAGWILIGVEY